jgi:hypothetical protein
LFTDEAGFLDAARQRVPRFTSQQKILKNVIFEKLKLNSPTYVCM